MPMKSITMSCSDSVTCMYCQSAWHGTCYLIEEQQAPVHARVSPQGHAATTNVAHKQLIEVCVNHSMSQQADLAVASDRRVGSLRACTGQPSRVCSYNQISGEAVVTCSMRLTWHWHLTKVKAAPERAQASLQGHTVGQGLSGTALNLPPHR